jgi:hypothetical protein
MSEPSPTTTFKKQIDAAVRAATGAGLSDRVIADILGAEFKYFDNRAYQAPHQTAIPRLVDGFGKPIDLAGQVEAAQREKERLKNERDVIPVDQRQVAASGYRR